MWGSLGLFVLPQGGPRLQVATRPPHWQSGVSLPDPLIKSGKWLVKALKIRQMPFFQILLPPEGSTPWLVTALRIRPGASLDVPKSNM